MPFSWSQEELALDHVGILLSWELHVCAKFFLRSVKGNRVTYNRPESSPNLPVQGEYFVKIQTGPQLMTLSNTITIIESFHKCRRFRVTHTQIKIQLCRGTFLESVNFYLHLFLIYCKIYNTVIFMRTAVK